ncbi:hypothetical protein GA0070616_4349 [Micromonospora nigra]|uniref:Uncharacterized protein n=1 Tax=Micromonospora nigra TaxID=145857 RepID=A0A1C6SQS5_9ACTN|nr:hypothetical protein [Micromonospora nigra]SCL31880.1 hypothetical protein GA0070616_4349 [Micromonospora nigra]
MAGQPQMREAGWLYGDDPYVPLAHVRLEERMDGSGWDIYLADPASGPSQHVRYPDEAGARAELERLYAAGREYGTWKIVGPEAG